MNSEEIATCLLEEEEEAFHLIYPGIKPRYKGQPIYKIEIWGKLWWQKTYGNTYCRAKVFINDDEVATLPEGGSYTLGGGEYYVQLAEEWFIAQEIIPLEKYSNGGNASLWRYCQDNDIEYLTHSDEVLKRELVNW